MTFKLESGDAEGLVRHWAELASLGIDAGTLVSPSEAPMYDKYDGCIPSSLLRRAYIADKLRTDELETRFAELSEEFGQRI